MKLTSDTIVTLINDSVDGIRQPLFLAPIPDEHYKVLINAMNFGWMVKEPVYLRPQQNNGGPWFYHFALKRDIDDQLLFISLRLSPKIERIVSEMGWQINSSDISNELY